MIGIGTSCGACKFLRRKCTSECVFAPYFCYDEAATHFAAVHKVFGASNVSKLLSHLPLQNRSDAATTISYEALARMGDPIYGCVAHIFALQQQIVYLQEEIELLGTQMANNFIHGVANTGSGSNITEANNYNQFAGSHIFSQNDGVSNTEQPQKEQPLLVSNAENANINQAFEFSTSCSLEDQENMHFSENSLERLFEGMDQENFRHYPWLDLDEGSSIGNL